MRLWGKGGSLRVKVARVEMVVVWYMYVWIEILF